MTEDKKYSKLYSGNYARGGSLQFRIVQKYIRFNNKSIIDFGCGNGWMRTKVKHNGYIGIDVASYFKDKCDDWAKNEIFIHGDLRYTTIQQTADISISLDVLEHIDEKYVDDVIKKIIAAGREVILGIACRPATHPSPDDDNLHRTVKDPDWWRDKISKFAKISAENVTVNYCLFFISDRMIVEQRVVLETVGGIRIRRSEDDGSYRIPRRNVIAERYLDSIGVRMDNQLKWILPFMGAELDFTETVYIVGKGPSLDYLRAEHFESDYSVLAINEAIHKIKELNLDNPIFMFQQDIKMTNNIKGITAIVAPRLHHIYGDGPKIIYINPITIGPNNHSLTVNFAISTAKRFDVRHLRLICFDACVNKNTDYADCIGYKSNRFNQRPERFLNHRKLIMEAAKGLNIEFIIPEALPSEVSDILQQ